MLNEDQIELKYHIAYVGNQRYYHQSLLEKEFTLENTTPYVLEAGGKTFPTSSWKQLLIDVCKEFLKDNPEKRTDLLCYTPSWTDFNQFSIVKEKNWEPVGDGIYLLSNHTAIHAFWLLREVLKIFNVDLKTCKFLIHRTPGSEPKEVRDFFEEKTKNAFRHYYTQLLKKPAEKAEQVIRNIEKLNKLMREYTRSYDNFFLIDNNNVYASYKAKFLDFLRFKKNIDENNIAIANKYLTILGTFYKDIR